VGAVERTVEPDGPRHLVLVGLMGAGKTTVGKVCAERLGRGFVDTDDLVEAGAGVAVADVFAAEGESGFRAREAAAVADAVASPEPLVIACGGGAVLDPANRRALRNAGVVVWLRASPDELGARVGEGSGRPLLAGGRSVATLERLAALRAGAYEEAAHVAVDTDGRTVDEVADTVLTRFETSEPSA
jgi:shikimate kinase